VKLGLLTAAFPELGLEEIARWASAAGFETLEIACRPAGAESERRYYDEWPGGTNLAYSPALWRQLFEIVPDANFGLNFDPSHLVWQFIDYERVIYDFVVSVEHEDRGFEGDEQLVKRGFEIAYRTLRPLIA
jgi:sugar phosphate isomerase/epimerase